MYFIGTAIVGAQKAVSISSWINNAFTAVVLASGANGGAAGDVSVFVGLDKFARLTCASQRPHHDEV